MAASCISNATSPHGFLIPPHRYLRDRQSEEQRAGECLLPHGNACPREQGDGALANGTAAPKGGRRSRDSSESGTLLGVGPGLCRTSENAVYANFAECPECEVGSPLCPTPIGPGPPARRCPYRRALLVVYAHTKDRDGGGLRGSARGKAKGRSPVAWELRPMREAGVPSTGGWVVPAPPGVVMLAPPEVPRNAERAQSEGRIVEDGQPPVATAFPASPLLF